MSVTDFDMVTKLQEWALAYIKFLEWPADKREQDEKKGNRGALRKVAAIADRSRALLL